MSERNAVTKLETKQETGKKYIYIKVKKKIQWGGKFEGMEDRDLQCLCCVTFKPFKYL